MFNIQIKEISNSQHQNDGTFLQTPFWCEFKARHGWTYKRFDVDYNLPPLNTNEDACENHKSSPVVESVETTGAVTTELAVLNRSFAKGAFSIAYIPLFPKLPYECTPEEVIDKAFEDNPVVECSLITPETQTIEFVHFLNELAAALKPQLPANTIAIRFDPDVSFSTPEDRDLFNYGMKTVAYADRIKLRKNSVDIQPPDSTLVDLTGTEEEILERMHSKWRYNIRLSAKKGVEVKKYTGKSINLSEKIDKFYELTKETNARDGNSSHAKDYYLDLIKSSAQEIDAGKDVPLISLYIAEHEGEEIAAIMTLFSHDEAIYLYGASSNKKRNLMPNHLLQWNAMKDAKAYGSKYYDMYGMPPEGEDENHPMHGLYMFKANFGGRIIHRIGSWDMPLKPFTYKLYSIAEGARAWWFKKFIKKLHGR